MNKQKIDPDTLFYFIFCSSAAVMIIPFLWGLFYGCFKEREYLLIDNTSNLDYGSIVGSYNSLFYFLILGVVAFFISLVILLVSIYLSYKQRS